MTAPTKADAATPIFATLAAELRVHANRLRAVAREAAARVEGGA